MEIASPCITPLFHHLQVSYNTCQRKCEPIKDHCCNIDINSSVRLTNNNPPSKPHHLPLRRRPIREQQLIVAPITRKKRTRTTPSDVLRLMDSLGLPIPADIYSSLIKECTDTRDIAEALQLHAHIRQSGLRPCLSLLNRLLLMYVSCGLIGDARHLFDKMSVRDSNSWAAMICAYAENHEYEEAINLFVKMQNLRLYRDIDDVLELPVSWILVCVLKGCVSTMNMGLGTQIHGWLLKLGYSMDLFLSSSLINFYGKCGSLEGADFVFDHLSSRNTVTWTAKVVNNCRAERFDEVIGVFKEMGRQRIRKNSFTLSSVLRACGRMRDDGWCGRQVHANAIKAGLESDAYIRCGLVDMYGKYGFSKDAKRVFETIGEERNTACWNAMLNIYMEIGSCVEATKLLYQMKAAGVEPRQPLLNEVRSACGSRDFDTNITRVCKL